MSVAGRDDPRVLDHEDHGPFGGAGAVLQPPGDRQPLPRLEREGLSLDVDKEAALDDEEELIVGLVPMPVVFPLDDAQSDDGIVHPDEGLIEPAVGAGRDDGGDIDDLEGAVLDVEMRRV
mgnify:CR=1 FL=1